jgi:hypothetical protein
VTVGGSCGFGLGRIIGFACAQTGVGGGLCTPGSGKAASSIGLSSAFKMVVSTVLVCM